MKLRIGIFPEVIKSSLIFLVIVQFFLSLFFLKRVMDAMLLFILLEVASIFPEAENLRLRYSRNEVIFDLHENRGILVISSSLLDENYG